MSLNQWPDIVSLVQYSLNTTECPTLGNLSPIEVFSGRKPRSTIDLFAFTGHTFNEIKNTTITSSVVKEHVVSLRATLQKISKRVEAKKVSKRISNNKNRKPLNEPHIHVGDFLLLARKRKKQSKLQFNWTGPYVALEPLTPHIWKIGSLDNSFKIEAHVQRLKRYADSSLMMPLRLIEEVRNEQEDCELDSFTDWRINRDTLMVELKCRWRGFTKAWDTFEDVETHLWLQKRIRKEILEYLHSQADLDPTIRSLLGRLESQLGNKRRNNGRGRGRGRGRNTTKAKQRNKNAVYKRPSGGWVARQLGTQRVFSSKTAAVYALEKYYQDNAEKEQRQQLSRAQLAQSLGGSVAGLYQSIPTGDLGTHPASYKTYDQAEDQEKESKIKEQQDTEWEYPTNKYAGLPEWQDWKYKPKPLTRPRIRLFQPKEVMTTTRENKTKMTWSEYKQKIKIPKKWGKRKTKINKRFCSKHGSRRQRYGHRSHNKRNK